MPKAKRERRERTDNYHLLQQWRRTPEQRLYEGIRPVVLFGIPPAERAQETGLAERSLGRAADAFDTAYQCETAERMEPDELLAGCRQFVRLHAPSEWPS